MALRILQSNLNHCAAAQDLLYQSLAQWNINIGIISEPYSIPEKTNCIGDLDGLAAIIVTPADSSPCIGPVRKGHGYVAAKLGSDMCIVSTYFSPNRSLAEFEAFLNELETLVQWSHPRHLVIAGDLNAKSAAWGSPVTRPRGNALMDWAAAHCMVVANKGSDATCVRANGESIVDVTFTSTQLSCCIQDWEVLTEVETLSDHRYIRFCILPPSANPVPVSTELGPKWALKSLNKEQAELATIVQAWCPSPASVEPEKEAEWFRGALTNIADAAMRRSRPGPHRTSVFWWSAELAQLRFACVAARRGYTRTRRRRPIRAVEERQAYSAYRAAKLALRTGIAEAKKKAWQELLDTLERDPWGRPYQIVTNKLRSRAPPLTTHMEPELLSTVVTELFPKRDASSTPHDTTLDHGEIVSEVSPSELKTAIARMSSKKTAPGPDGMHGRVLALALDAGLDMRFRNLLTECLKRGLFPSTWKTGLLVLLKKGGKPPESPSAYRPIVLLDEAGKLFERIIAGRIYNHLETIGPNIHEAQFGFRKNRSTIDAIAQLRGVCEEQVSRGRVVLAVSLDIANAFNSLPWDCILDGLRHHGLPAHIRRCVASYLNGRRVIFPKQNSIGSHLIKCGVPQGSVLGPLLWNIGYDRVLRGELVPGVSTICYADDTLVVAIGQDFKEARLRATAGVARVVSEIKKIGLEVALQKSEAICFYGHRKAPPQGADIIVSGVVIRVGTTLKYLGLILDPRWTFRPHFAALAPKLTATANMLSRIMPNLGGPNGGCRHLYANAIRAKALYGCPIWADKLTRHNRTILRQSQRVIAARVARAYRTVSYDAVCVIAGTAPWHLDAVAFSEVYWRRAETRERGSNPTLEEINAWRALEAQEMLAEWEKELAGATAGKYTIEALRPLLQHWVRRRWGQLSYRLVQILSGHGCFGSYLHRVVGCEEAPTCHHCVGDSPDDALHTLRDCPAWDVERGPLLDALQGEDATLPNVLKVLVSARNDGPWKIFYNFCEAVMKIKEEAERTRELCPDAHPRRRRKPQARRVNARRAHQILAA